ncbi:hypothetical protein M422DRAFT_244121 [Sphaerobolus stellatus SS14]|nr:hypothetical protein M422DRAFT_244121 [Sphaerobolus stellatus SS14]
MVTKHLILKALDWNSPLDIWVVIDGSNFGVGGYIGQGKEWNTCHPAGALAVLEALAKWQDKLLGRKFFLVTNNKSLTFFKTQETLTARQVRLWDFISRFDYEPIHVPGVLNIVADCLSCYFKNDLPEEVHPEWEYINIDVWLDPDGDTLPVDRYVEMAANREIRVSAAARHTNRLKERPEPREEEVDQSALPEGEHIDSNNEDDVLVFNSGADKVNLPQHIEGDNSFLDLVRNNYVNDNLLAKVVADVSVHKQFAMRDKL